jgi:hypothetical protein
MGQEEQFASRKTSRKSNNYLIRGKIRIIYKGQGGTKMATQSMACPTALAKAGWFIGGLPQQFASAGLDKNAGCNCSQSIGPIKELIQAKM